MQRLSIRHETRYAYERPVSFSTHRLMVRPRDTHALRLIDASLELSPPGDVRWIYDAHGNSICCFTPQGQARELKIVSRITVDRFPAELQMPAVDPHSAFPVVYSQADRLALSPLLTPDTEDDTAALTSWLRGYIGHPGEPILYYLQRLNRAIHDGFEYAARYEEGVQAPTETLSLRRGTCRDFAWLMVESMRRLGLAARFVSGYIYSPRAQMRGAGSTHAWCEVFLPGLGWIEFDPTNGLQESADLIPVAIARTPQEASPISGALEGDPGHCGLEVFVDVQLVNGTEEASTAVAA